jgi:hypothetical protein
MQVGIPASPLPYGTPGAPLEKGTARTKEIARLGGLARAEQRRALVILTGIGVKKDSRVFEDAETKDYALLALDFVVAETERLAAIVGGGYCPPPAAACIQAAARAMIWSLAAADRGDHATSMNADYRMQQHLIAAHQICVQEAKARASKPRVNKMMGR